MYWSIIQAVAHGTDNKDENLVRAENEDKITPYFMFLISIAAVAGFLFGYGLSNQSITALQD